MILVTPPFATLTFILPYLASVTPAHSAIYMIRKRWATLLLICPGGSYYDPRSMGHRPLLLRIP